MRSWGWYVMGSLLLHGVLLWMGWGGGIHLSRKPLAYPMVGVQLMGAYDDGATQIGEGPVGAVPAPTASSAQAVSPTGKSRPASPAVSQPINPVNPVPAPSTHRPLVAPQPAVASEGAAGQGIPMGKGNAQEPVANGLTGGGASEGEIVAMAGPMQSGNPSPVYPPQAREWGHQGVVRLSVRVLRTGAVADIKVKTSSGHPALDQAALDTVKRWRFTPARTQTGPIDSWVSIPIRFRLTDS